MVDTVIVFNVVVSKNGRSLTHFSSLNDSSKFKGFLKSKGKDWDSVNVSCQFGEGKNNVVLKMDNFHAVMNIESISNLSEFLGVQSSELMKDPKEICEALL